MIKNGRNKLKCRSWFVGGKAQVCVQLCEENWTGGGDWDDWDDLGDGARGRGGEGDDHNSQDPEPP
jgi:hypothetical protein